MLWGNGVSVLGGDLLLVNALERTAEHAPEIMPELVATSGGSAAAHRRVRPALIEPVSRAKARAQRRRLERVASGGRGRGVTGSARSGSQYGTCRKLNLGRANH